MYLFFILATVKTPGSIVFRSVCYRPCLYIKLSATAAHWDCCVCSICMHGVWVCVSGRKCVWERQTEKVRERERERGGELCVSGVCVCIFVWVSVYTCVCLVQVLGPVCVPGQGMQGSLDSPLLPANETTTHLHTPTYTHTYTPHRSGWGWGSLCAPLANR